MIFFVLLYYLLVYFIVFRFMDSFFPPPTMVFLL